MRPSRRLAHAVPLILAVAFGLSGLRPSTPTVVAAESKPEAILGRDPGTGRLIFVGSRTGRPLPSSIAGATALTKEQVALSFVKDYAPQLGLREADTGRSTRACRSSALMWSSIRIATASSWP
jgi:hypothetical protein